MNIKTIILAIMTLPIMVACQTNTQEPNHSDAENDAVVDLKKDEAVYHEYSESLVDEAIAADKRVFLFFYAERCGPCRKTDKEMIQKISDDLPGDIVMLKVNYDEKTELRKKYKVTQKHTFIELGKNKEEVDRFVGGGVDDILEKCTLEE